MNYLVKLLAKKEVAEKTTAFFFEKPKKFKFVPGQFIEIQINKNLTHEFSIASSPKEKELMVATRMRPTKFKKALGKMKTGARVKIDGPFGQFALHKNKKIPAVLLAGGIGITPFRSMIKFATDKKLNHRINLFFSNRRLEDAPFLDELKKLEEKNKKFKLVATMTDMKNSSLPWKGLKGYIDQKMIKNNLKDWGKSFYYLAGPPGMVQSMANLLSEMGIKPEQIKTENFSGY